MCYHYYIACCRYLKLNTIPAQEMPPVVLPEAALPHHDDYGTDEADLDEADKAALTKHGHDTDKALVRRDSTGSTGYSTCSSNLSSVSQHLDQPSPRTRSPDSPVQKIFQEMNELSETLKSHKDSLAVHKDRTSVHNKNDLVQEEENDGDTENNNEEDENGNENAESGELKPKKMSPVEFANQVCANQRCVSAGFKGKRKGAGIEQIRRGSTGYNTASEVRSKQVTPESLGEAITSVINKLEDNIRDLNSSTDEAMKQLQEEHESKFLQFTLEQEETLMKINSNIVQAEEETQRIKAQHDVAIENLKDSILKVSADSTDLINEKENVFNEKQEELHSIAVQHELFIKDLTESLNKISNENKESVSMLLANLDKAKRDNEEGLENHHKALNELKEFQERSIADLKNELDSARELSENFKNQTEEANQNFQEENTELKAKLAFHDTAIKSLENTLMAVTEKNNEMHHEVARTHKKSMGDLRQEVFSQVMVVKEISRGVQEEFNDKLENIGKILDDEKITNKDKIEEVREALDGIDMDIKMKMKETTDHLLAKIEDEVKQKGDGKYDGIDVEISMVKVFKVTQ